MYLNTALAMVQSNGYSSIEIYLYAHIFSYSHRMHRPLYFNMYYSCYHYYIVVAENELVLT